MMKNVFYFMLKAQFVLFNTLNSLFRVKSSIRSLSRFFGCVKKQLHKKAMVNFKIYDVTDWTARNYKAHIAQYLMKERQADNEMWSVNKM